MSTGRKVLIVIAVLLGIVLLFALLQSATTEPAKASEGPRYRLVNTTARVVVEPRQAGCNTAYVEGKIEQAVVGFDILKASMEQHFCWRDGRITSLSKPKRWQHVTDYGAALNFREDGWRRGSSGWTHYGGKSHGGHFVNMTARFKACAPIPTGCVLPKKYGIRLSIVVHKGGGTDVAVNRDR